MPSEKLRQSFEVLCKALPPGIELGMPWPHDQGYDDYESPSLIYEAAQDIGGQAFLTGDAALVEAFLELSRNMAEPRVVGFWLRYASFYSDDDGAGLQQLVGGWRSSTDPLKRYLAEHAKDLVEAGPTS
ncbi:hypothetical protein [Pelomonas cellulosilytica]|uniref:CdiI immunity protein domain-containing protein n=1 Tax=Pelomonas cellulosilytica TaxID=2906762 RepID=A0ABS8Y5R4_9BURK|nr:hypothetical protein [Pelomonas sp. P8]MCE4557880.1 hypothetical protein [Pelomonas sp. P8]